MGTNYYLHTDECPHCKRPRDRVHIGKSSAGWPFLFRGYRQWPPDGVPAPITRMTDWRELLSRETDANGVIMDEHGGSMGLLEFFDMVRHKQGQTAGPDSCTNYKFGAHKSEWYDEDGYRFCDSEFS